MRLIDCDAAIDRYYSEWDKRDICDGAQDRNWLKQCIDDAPTIDPKDLRPHGENMTQMRPSDEFICSVCGVVIQDMTRYSPEDETYYKYEPNFCPNCGARMEERNDS